MKIKVDIQFPIESRVNVFKWGKNYPLHYLAYTDRLVSITNQAYYIANDINTNNILHRIELLKTHQTNFFNITDKFKNHCKLKYENHFIFRISFENTKI